MWLCMAARAAVGVARADRVQHGFVLGDAPCATTARFSK